MIPVVPESSVQQHHNDVVLYEIDPRVWDADLSGAALKKDAEFGVVERRGGGAVLEVQTVASTPKPGPKTQTIRVSGGRAGGSYDVVRIVETKTGERRRKSFTVRVT